MTARPVRFACVLALVVSSCTTQQESPQPRPSPVGPAPAGTVRVGYPSEPPTLDPLEASGASPATRDILRPLLPSLFSLDSKSRPIPALVEAWPNPSQITFDPFSVQLRLRRAKWSDGRAITARDVKFSFDRLRVGPTREHYRFLSDVEVTGPRGFVLHFDRPVRRWWALFSLDDMILPAHAYSDEWRNGPTVSGGPFQFDGWTRGLTIRLKANPAWWGRSPGLEHVDVMFVASEEVRMQLIDTGELDVVWAAGEPNLGQRAVARGFPIREAATGQPTSVGAWSSAWWELDLDAGKVQAGLAEAISLTLRRDLAAEMLEDSGQVMNGIPARFPVPGPTDEGLPALAGPFQGSPDIAKAKQVLARAGFRPGDPLRTPGGDPVELRLAYVAGSSSAAGLAQMIHFQLRPLGVRVELIGLDSARLEREWYPNRQADAWLVLRRASDAPDDSVYRPASGQPGAVDGFDAKSDVAATTASRSNLKSGHLTGLDSAAWRSAQDFLIGAHSVLPLVRVRTWMIVREPIAGPDPTFTGAGPFWNLQDWSSK